MIHDCALTTVDNPYDPFEQFASWLLFDSEKGYNCCSVLARIAKVSDDMTEKEIVEEQERAIDEIIKHDFLNIYKKVKNPKSNLDQNADDEEESSEITH